MFTDLPTKRIQAISQWKTVITFLPTRWRQKLSGIDMEQNYVTVTLCILTGCILSSSIVGLLKKPALLTSLTLWTLDSSMSEPQQQERHRSFFFIVDIFCC